MESKHYECVFLADKLGMLYSVHEGKVIVIGLDSNQYKQTTSSVLTATSVPKEASADLTEEDENSKYEGVITLDPTRASLARNDESVAREPADAEEGPAAYLSCTNKEPAKLKHVDSSSTMTAAEVLSALANFEEDPEEESSLPPAPAEQSTVDPPGTHAAHVGAEPSDEMSPSSSHHSIMGGHASKTVGEVKFCDYVAHSFPIPS
jgi:hypothetical protein